MKVRPERIWLGLGMGSLLILTLAYLFVLHHDLREHQRLDALAIHQLVTARILGHLELVRLLPPSAPAYLKGLAWLTDELQGQPLLSGVMVWTKEGPLLNSFPEAISPLAKKLLKCPLELEKDGVFYLCREVRGWPGPGLFILVGVDESFKQDVWREGLLHGLVILAGGVAILLGLGLYLEGLRRKEEKLRETLAESQRLATVGRMAAMLTHEIRNPLNTLSMGVQMLREVGEVRPEILDRMGREIHRLSSLAEELLSLARGIKVDLRPVSLKDVVREALASPKALAEMKGVEIKVFPLPEDSILWADLRWLVRALENLLRNAVEASPAGKTVELRITVSPEETVFTIKDQGPGISPEDQRRIFDPFFSRKREGFGLGLFIVERVVKAHGGRIILSSHPGRGTSFEVHIPSGGKNHAQSAPHRG